MLLSKLLAVQFRNMTLILKLRNQRVHQAANAFAIKVFFLRFFGGWINGRERICYAFLLSFNRFEFWMNQIELVLESARFAEDHIINAMLQFGFDPFDAFEPYEFNDARSIRKLGHQSLSATLTNCFYGCYSSSKLDVGIISSYAVYLMKLCSINITEWEMMQ